MTERDCARVTGYLRILPSDGVKHVWRTFCFSLSEKAMSVKETAVIRGEVSSEEEGQILDDEEDAVNKPEPEEEK